MQPENETNEPAQMTLANIQERLWATPIPDKYVKSKSKGGTTIHFLNWRVYIRHFDALAPGWEMRISEPTYGEAWHEKKGETIKVPTVSVCVHVTIRGIDGARTLGSVATVESNDAEFGLPADKAQWIAMKKAMRMHGLIEPDAIRNVARAKMQGDGASKGNGQRQQERRQAPPARQEQPKASAPASHDEPRHGSPAGEDMSPGEILTNMRNELEELRDDGAALGNALARYARCWERMPAGPAKTAQAMWQKYEGIRKSIEAHQSA